jgi:hypothetical protein
VTATVRTIEELIDREPPGAEVRIRNARNPVAVTLSPTTEFPGWAAIFVLYHGENVVRGRRVRFVEADAGVRAAVGERSPRLAELLVAPTAP